jgi:perosamine synthetase
MLAGRARVASLYSSALESLVDVGLALPCPDVGSARRGWFVYVVQLPRGMDRDSVVRELSDVGIPSKPYFPAVHLMSYYRETFGHRPGEFPVCEDVAARSIALPFFPQMTEGQVARVASALGDIVLRPSAQR